MAAKITWKSPMSGVIEQYYTHTHTHTHKSGAAVVESKSRV